MNRYRWTTGRPLPDAGLCLRRSTINQRREKVRPFRVVPFEDMAGEVLDLMRDGKPRSLETISLELSGTPAEESLGLPWVVLELVEAELLWRTVQLPILFVCPHVKKYKIGWSVLP